MKLYDYPTAPSPRRVRIFLAEKGVEAETVTVDLAKGEQFADDFRGRNPDCAVPVLELDDGTCISEVLAICQYIEELHPQPSLLGGTPEERARISMWTAKVELQGLSAAADAVRNTLKAFDGRSVLGPVGYEQIPELAERGFARVDDFMHRLDAQLADNPFVAGDRFTIADIAAFVMVDFMKWVRTNIPEDCTSVSRWYDEVSQRPSAAA
ncbi:MAG: glutathione S-transferase family protein [Woeseiaceae bacterium]|nr:glutathione S-transferase family protein [Gammaproteobacteria bacterium]NNK25998.1 glutathione S-transferase family protein [Woeseiaceae bacterium]